MHHVGKAFYMFVSFREPCHSNKNTKTLEGIVLTVLSQPDLLCCPLDQNVDRPQHTAYCYQVKEDGAEDLPPLTLGHVELLPLEDRQC